MKLRYNGPHDEVDIPALRQVVKQGETVEATGDVAKALVKQGWEKVDKADTKEDEE